MRALVLAISLSASVAYGQSLPVKLHDGDTWSFTAKHERIVEGPNPQNFTVTTVKTLTWRPGTDGGQLLMAHVSVTADSGMPPEAAITQTLTIPVRLTVDAALAPNGVINVDEVRAAARDLILSSGASQADLGRMAKVNPAILDQTAMALVGRELGLLARVQGTSLKPDLPTFVDDEVPNPLGGPPLRSRMIYLLEFYDAARGQAAVSWQGSVDPQSVHDSLAELAGRAPPERQAEADAAFAKMKVENARDCRGKIDIPTGLATKLTCVNTVSVADGDVTRRTSDRWDITQTLPGRPQ